MLIVQDLSLTGLHLAIIHLLVKTWSHGEARKQPIVGRLSLEIEFRFMAHGPWYL